jgi:hypothetical protein
MGPCSTQKCIILDMNVILFMLYKFGQHNRAEFSTVQYTSGYFSLLHFTVLSKLVKRKSMMGSDLVQSICRL